MISRYAVLKDKKVVIIDSPEEWGAMFEDAENRRVAHTEIDKGANVSTVFLGLNHRFGDGPPLWFESMAFGLPDGSELQERYTTWDEAEAGHEKMVNEARSKISLYASNVEP